MTTTVHFYNDFMKLALNGTIKIATDTFRIILVQSGYTYDAAHTKKLDVVANELATGYGYTANGLALTGQSLNFSGNDTIFDADDASWIGDGGVIGPVTGAVIFSDTSADDMLVCYIDFGGSKTASEGSTFLMAFATGGIVDVNKS